MTQQEEKLKPFKVMKMHEGCSGCSAHMMSSPMDTRSERDQMIKILDNYIRNLDVEIAEDEAYKRERQIDALLLNQKLTESNLI